jgi:DNA-directed RNA polymerase specialized sigma24 family protein
MARDETSHNSVDPRLEALGAQFTEYRPRLLRFFSARGRAFKADELADETILRMITKVQTGIVIENVGAYALTVGRLVLLEDLRRPVPDALEADPPVSADEPPDTAALDCLDLALGAMPHATRDVILRFYGKGADDAKAKDTRRQLADDLRMTRQALDSRASRGRRVLEQQIGDCLRHRASATGIRPFAHGR